MRTFIIYLFLSTLFSCKLFSQDNDSSIHRIRYTNTNNIEIFVNRESGFSDKINSKSKGFGVEFNSFHGVYFLRKISITIGVGIAFNINEDFKALPIVGQIKYHLYPFNEDGPFVLLNTGRNLKINNFTSGRSSKLGLGYIFESDSDFRYIIGAFLKSKEYLLNKETNFNYQAESLGLSVGIQF